MTVVTDDGREATAIALDVSAAGLLMGAPGTLNVDQHLTLRFAVDDAEERTVGARVRRVEPHDEGSVWRHRLAVEFDSPQPELEAALERAAARDDSP